MSGAENQMKNSIRCLFLLANSMLNKLVESSNSVSGSTTNVLSTKGAMGLNKPRVY